MVIYIPLFVLNSESRMVSIFWACSATSLKFLVIWVSVLISTPNQIKLKHRCPDYCCVGNRQVYLSSTRLAQLLSTIWATKSRRISSLWTLTPHPLHTRQRTHFVTSLLTNNRVVQIKFAMNEGQGASLSLQWVRAAQTQAPLPQIMMCMPPIGRY